MRRPLSDLMLAHRRYYKSATYTKAIGFPGHLRLSASWGCSCLLIVSFNRSEAGSRLPTPPTEYILYLAL
jgi:hypothetical protein